LFTKISAVNLEKQQWCKNGSRFHHQKFTVRRVLSDKEVTCDVKLALLHLNRGLLVVIALGYSGVLILLLSLVLPRVRAFIGIMPWLPTIVANAGWKFFWLGGLLLGLMVLKFSRRLMLGRGRSPAAR
jgi:hypothetical protein